MSQTTTSLTKSLSTEIDFYFAYKYFHWNVAGQDFKEFHEMFDQHATLIYAHWDIIAERIRQLDAPVTGSLQDYQKHSIIEKTRPATKSNMQGILKYLVAQHQVTIDLLTEIIDSTSEAKDFATADILTAFLRDHQQMQWFAKSSIE